MGIQRVGVACTVTAYGGAGPSGGIRVQNGSSSFLPLLFPFVFLFLWAGVYAQYIIGAYRYYRAAIRVFKHSRRPRLPLEKRILYAGNTPCQAPHYSGMAR